MQMQFTEEIILEGEGKRIQFALLQPPVDQFQ